MTGVRQRLILTLAVAVWTPVGCGYDYAPVRVEVRERATRAPSRRAAVRITNTRTLNPRPPAGAWGVTDDAGAVTLEVAIYNDLIVRVTPVGGIEHVFSVPHPSRVGPMAWRSPTRTVGGRAPTVEVRLSPGFAESSEPAEPDPPGRSGG